MFKGLLFWALCGLGIAGLAFFSPLVVPVFSMRLLLVLLWATVLGMISMSYVRRHLTNRSFLWGAWSVAMLGSGLLAFYMFNMLGHASELGMGRALFLYVGGHALVYLVGIGCTASKVRQRLALMPS
jgi:hypothetical protein